MGTVSSLSREHVETGEQHAGELSGRFPPDFVFGAATASYQIEGAVDEDGRGQSIWDTFSAMPGAVFKGHTGAVACDHYHRYRDDIRLMGDLGLNTYRFSIAWPRVIPNGTGAVNQRGLDFYDRLVDQLLEAGIEPLPTLYHWDLPQALEEAGGWYVRSTAEAFAEYAAVVVERLSDRIKAWITLNEPWVSAWVGYGEGRHAPGRQDGQKGAIKAGHNLLLAHGLSLSRIRSLTNARVGITLNLSPSYPASGSSEDKTAALLADVTSNRWYLDPLYLASYPIEIPEYIEHLPSGWQEDLATIALPTDFLGVNYYTRQVVTLDPETGRARHVDLENERMDSGWEVYPDGLRVLLERLAADYRAPSIYITENGAAYADAPDSQGRVHDERRTDYLRRHLSAVADAIAAGARIDGYFVWSLLDNFEWGSGYDDNTRFGIVYVDFESQERFMKDSGRWYASLIAAHGGEREG